MNRGIADPRKPLDTPPPATGPSNDDGTQRVQWRQLALITLAAIALYAGLRLLPTGTNLNHMDFRAEGKNAIEFCDPLNPQFIPVVEARSPVSMRVVSADTPSAGQPLNATLTLRTSGGKPVTPDDLLVVHTRPLHLMVVDPSLEDYQHLHPQPGRAAGEWTFSFVPLRSGVYRVFADFTPVATGRGLYASTDLNVGEGARSAGPAGQTVAGGPVDREGFLFELVPERQPIRARQPIDFRFRIAALAGGPVPMEPVMGAYAHLVAFDTGRKGFAHLHPAQADPLQAPDAVKPQLGFKLTIPKPGRYVIWSQVNLGGREVFAPFWFDVAE